MTVTDGQAQLAELLEEKHNLSQLSLIGHGGMGHVYRAFDNALHRWVAVKVIRPEALRMLDTVIECCDELKKLLDEFSDFKRSEKLKPIIIRINSLEEEADKLYIDNMRKLHVEEKDVLQIIAWREIYTYLEKCADTCEHAADVVGSVVMTNS